MVTAQYARLAPQRHRILVVDDDLDTAQTLAVMLREMGHQVEFAINGRAGLEAARRFRPDTVLLDMVLPDLDGSDLSRLLRIQAEPEQLCIVAITGRAGEAARERAVQAGCDEFLLKPLDWGALERVLAD
jgi:DNA-binding response OmpR family regulator